MIKFEQTIARTNAYKPEGMLINTEQNQEILKDPAKIEQLIGSRKIIEAKAIICDSSHNLIVDMVSMRGIIPKNETAIGISEGKTRDIAIISRVNKPVSFYVSDIIKNEYGEDVAILSRKAVQQDAYREYIKKLKSGDIVDAKVSHLENFGAFVDLACGISSLIPIDAISISRISHPKDRFKVGQKIKAVVKSVDEEARVFLSHKELLGTWEENASRFENGETVSGVVRSIEEYGIFIELAPNLAGLAELKSGVKVGQVASVFIKSLIPQKMKVKLIIVDAFDESECEECPKEYSYFVQEEHISYWRYSPSDSNRVVEEFFE